ncbi:tRNA(Ile)(2)-agmatinylcytidine synthase [Candidatus Bathyarchaeota archaeon]|nr:tRNA(Ile)(2)-agmatinylcytidine synthase [Candidatus Bathyarchaeota archaeon]
MVHLHIGIDDTDSPRGGCTTYVVALLVEKLAPLAIFRDYPNLIRLNPNVQWKTRGNGAVCLRVESLRDEISRIEEIVVETVEKNSDIGYAKTDPGIIFLEGPLTSEIQEFGKRCLREVITKAEAFKTLKYNHGEGIGYGSGIGLIGALAAVGNLLEGDHTYELLAYRRTENRGSERRVDSTSVLSMDRATKGTTFSNVDWERKRVLITPRGPDPVLLGIRGESCEAVKKAFVQVSLGENVERWVVFRTNQGTEQHLPPKGKIASFKPRCPIVADGTVSQNPQNIPGRHVIFKLRDESGEIYVAAYEPSGNLRKIARELKVGDRLRVFGGVRPAEGTRPLTINLEKLEILDIVQETAYTNPSCPSCARSMESMGREKGYRCRYCGLREPFGQQVSSLPKRSVEPGLFLPPPRSQRHLTKPLSRYGLERPYLQVIPKDFWGLDFPNEGTTSKASVST